MKSGVYLFILFFFYLFILNITNMPIQYLIMPNDDFLSFLVFFFFFFCFFFFFFMFFFSKVNLVVYKFKSFAKHVPGFPTQIRIPVQPHDFPGI